MTAKMGIPVAFAALLVTLSGCPLSYETESDENIPPITFFEQPELDDEVLVPIVTDQDISFQWLGTDLDSDVVAYQFQWVETDSLYAYTGGLDGRVIRSIVPRREIEEGGPDEFWAERTTDNRETFTQLADGFYEMRVRAIDDTGTPDPTPARYRFEVFVDDVSPIPSFVPPECGGRISTTRYTFTCTAEDSSTYGVRSPRTSLSYRYRLRSVNASSCPAHAADNWTDWISFPDETTPIVIDGTRIGLPGVGGTGGPYNDFFSPGCSWTFQFQVRDIGGNEAEIQCTIERTS
jgi:hypothetical protein